MESHICPRCEGYVPNNQAPGLYPGALSRTDNKTMICSSCGEEEALIALVPQEMWSVGKWDLYEFAPARKRMLDRISLQHKVMDEVEKIAKKFPKDL